jgi:hypothetical protein
MILLVESKNRSHGIEEQNGNYQRLKWLWGKGYGEMLVNDI